MSSSRWRRFAFFDRSNLSIPDDILKEILSPEGVSSFLNSSSGVNKLDSGLSLRMLSENTSSYSDLFSLTACACSLESLKMISEDKSTPSTGLNASRLFTNAPSVVSVQALVSSCGVMMPSSSSMANYPTSKMKEKDLYGIIDPCVFVFVSSRFSNKVYCIDVSARCNPPINSDISEQDMDGYRGSFIPFEGDTGSNNDDNDAIFGRVIDLASAEYKRNIFLAVVTDDVCVKNVIAVYKNPQSMVVNESESKCYKSVGLKEDHYGKARVVCIIAGFAAIGTSKGYVIVYSYPIDGDGGKILVWKETPPPRSSDDVMVTSVNLTSSDDDDEMIRLFVTYCKISESDLEKNDETKRPMGVCCFELGKRSSPRTNTSFLARFDLDGRDVCSKATSNLDSGTGNLVIAQADGLYFFTPKNQAGVAPIDDGVDKLLMCCIPSFDSDPSHHTMSSYALVAGKDLKSSRDSVDVYDTNNKLVAFHALLSPGQKALNAVGVTTKLQKSDESEKNGRASAIILTSGGTLSILTEKTTNDKVSLLLGKNLFTAAISLAYADPHYSRDEISLLYRKHAEFLYNKGEFEEAMEQFLNTIGMGVSIVEPSHVIYRYLDAPKIPYLVKYLETLREKKMAFDSHLRLLQSCYYKLNDVENAERIAEESNWRNGRLNSNDSSDFLAAETLSHDPLEAFKAISAMDAPQAAYALKIHGSSLARALPRETAGIVISLCDGTFSPHNLAASAAACNLDRQLHIEQQGVLSETKVSLDRACEKYPVKQFSSAFLENPKLLRLILAHCRRNKSELTPSELQTLLDLTLQEWNEAKHSMNVEIEKNRSTEALAILSDPHAQNIGDYEALVIVQLAGFTDGEILLYERLQMSSMLLERYAQDGGERARRQMLATCAQDGELLADVLGYFVLLASDQCFFDTTSPSKTSNAGDDASEKSEAKVIFEDIQEALEIAKLQGVLSPVRIARILAGESTSQFSSHYPPTQPNSVPLSVALDYVGGILDDTEKKITRLKSEILEYNQSCNAMEAEIQSLLPSFSTELSVGNINIENMYQLLQKNMENHHSYTHMNKHVNLINEQEEFWREMEQSEDRFQTISRFFGKGLIP